MVSALNLSGVLGGGCFLIALTFIFVLVRLTSNISQLRRLCVDDYAAVVALVFVVGSFVINILSMNLLDKSNPTPTTYGKLAYLAYLSNFVGSYSTFFSKTPTLLLYVRLFGIKKSIRYASYITIIVMFIPVFVGSTICGTVCDPKQLTNSKPCLKSLTTKGTYVGVVSVVVDLIMISLPLTVISHLKLSFKKKLGLVFVFSTGVLGIAASAIALWLKNRSSTGDNNIQIAALIASIIETCIAIIVSCTPACSLFYNKFIAESTVYQNLISRLSRMTSWGADSANNSLARTAPAPSERPLCAELGNPKYRVPNFTTSPQLTTSSHDATL